MSGLFPRGSAVFSPCPDCEEPVDVVTGKCTCGVEALYRYALTRELDGGRRTLVIMGVNPSTATAEEDDATIRRDMGFGRSLGFGRLVKLNLFAWRDKDVKSLLRTPDPVGQLNDAAIETQLDGADLFIAAWGAKVGKIGKLVNARAAAVLSWVRRDVFALRITPGGAPEHTLFLPGDLQPVLYRRAA